MAKAGTLSASDQSGIEMGKEQFIQEAGATKSDPIAMYNAGILALRQKKLVEAYIWFSRAAPELDQWASKIKGRRGEERFNSRYLVSEVAKVRDEVATNTALIRSQLTAHDLDEAERVLSGLR